MRFDLEYSISGRFVVEAQNEDIARKLLEEHLRENKVALKVANLEIHSATESCTDCD